MYHDIGQRYSAGASSAKLNASCTCQAPPKKGSVRSSGPRNVMRHGTLAVRGLSRTKRPPGRLGIGLRVAFSLCSLFSSAIRVFAAETNCPLESVLQEGRR